MKIRIGVGLGPAPVGDGAGLAGVVDDLVELGFDSIWLPEILTAPTLDPLVGLAFAAAHNPQLKLGTTILLPGRNPVRLAKQLAGLDRLSAGRLLVTFVPGSVPSSRKPVRWGWPAGAKGRMMDEMLPLLRRLWAGETVTHHGDAADFDGVTLSPLPVQQPLEFWTGGMVPAALRRCGRFADGWLPSSCTPEEVAAARVVIDEAAEEAGRAISPGALRGVHRLCPRSALAADDPGRLPPPAAGWIPSRWSRWGSTGCVACSRASARWDSPSSWSDRW